MSSYFWIYQFRENNWQKVTRLPFNSQIPAIYPLYNLYYYFYCTDTCNKVKEYHMILLDLQIS